MSTSNLPEIFPLDITGTSINNKIVSEVVTLTTRVVRSIAPIYAPFFGSSVVITDTNTGLVLPRTAYSFYCLLTIPTAMYGMDIYSIILITDPTVSNNVTITYQTLGGGYCRSYTSTKNLIDVLYDDTRPVQWPNIVNTPVDFAPTMHFHSAGDGVGFEYLVTALEELRINLMLSSNVKADIILKYVESRLMELNNINIDLMSTINVTNNNISTFKTHISNTNNPHNVTKTQVGLSNLFNYGPTNNNNDLVNPDSANPLYVTNMVLKSYVDSILNTIKDEVNNLTSNTNTQLSGVITTVNNINAIVGNIFNINTAYNNLNTNYINLNNRMTACETNLVDSKNRAAAMINQYLSSGN